VFAVEAKKRQVRKPANSVPQKIGEQKHSGEAINQAAQAVGTNCQYVSDIKKICDTA
jgi:hypothetical protein